MCESYSLLYKTTWIEKSKIRIITFGDIEQLKWITKTCCPFRATGCLLAMASASRLKECQHGCMDVHASGGQDRPVSLADPKQ